jgi:hypothetical protein
MSEYSVEVAEWKGSPVIALLKGDKRVLSFGLAKAKAIIACIESIQKFVKDNSEGV